MSEFHGPKCQEMCFPVFSFQKFSGGACPRTPLETKAHHMGPLDPQPSTFQQTLAT